MAQSRSLAILILCGICSYVSVLTAHWNAGLAVTSVVAPTSFESSPKFAMQGATIAFLKGRGDPNAVDLPQIRSKLSLSPLEDEPFTFSAARQFEGGDPLVVEQYLRVALLRNPRSREARIYLLELLVDQRRAAEAIEQIEVLSVLMPDRRGFLQSNLLYLATLPETREETLLSLKDQGSKALLLRNLANAGASASMILDTYQSFDDFRLGEDSDAMISSWVSPLIRSGDYDGAKRVWSFFHPSAKSELFVYDSAFDGRLGPPFGWKVYNGQNGYARFSENGLVGEFFGRRRAILADQTLLLRPGSFAVSFANTEDTSALRVKIDCLTAGNLMNEQIEQAVVLNFQVPSNGCEAQNLQIIGWPREPPRTVSYRIGAIEIGTSSSD